MILKLLNITLVIYLANNGNILPQQALVSSAKIRVSYVKYEQLARQSKVALELIRKIKRYRKCSRGLLLNSYDKRYIVTLA